VLSTLHTNDAVGGISRLLDMGIEPFMVASSVRAFQAQRLVRTLCGACKQPAHYEEAI
jgi:general secretion pathway protein E